MVITTTKLRELGYDIIADLAEENHIDYATKRYILSDKEFMSRIVLNSMFLPTATPEGGRFWRLIMNRDFAKAQEEFPRFFKEMPYTIKTGVGLI